MSLPDPPRSYHKWLFFAFPPSSQRPRVQLHLQGFLALLRYWRFVALNCIFVSFWIPANQINCNKPRKLPLKKKPNKQPHTPNKTKQNKSPPQKKTQSSPPDKLKHNKETFNSAAAFPCFARRRAEWQFAYKCSTARGLSQRRTMFWAAFR